MGTLSRMEESLALPGVSSKTSSEGQASLDSDRAMWGTEGLPTRLSANLEARYPQNSQY